MHAIVKTCAYGPGIEDWAKETGQGSEATHATAILWNPGHQGEVRKAVIANGRAGAGQIDGPSFGLRGELHRPNGLNIYRAVVEAQAAVLDQAIASLRLRNRPELLRAMSFGPYGDCYRPETAPATEFESRDFHRPQAAEAARFNQIAWFETVNTIQEAIGMAQAAKHHDTLCVISFVLNRQGKLLSGESLQDAIRAVDAATGKHPLGYSINCCPIESLEPALQSCGKYVDRMVAAYPNASSRDQLELESHDGVIGVINPLQTASYLNYLAKKYGLRIIGGCCGFNPADVAAISAATRHRLSSPTLPPTDISDESTLTHPHSMAA